MLWIFSDIDDYTTEISQNAVVKVIILTGMVHRVRKYYLNFLCSNC